MTFTAICTHNDTIQNYHYQQWRRGEFQGEPSKEDAKIGTKQEEKKKQCRSRLNVLRGEPNFRGSKNI